MYTAKIENNNGEILTLTGKEKQYQIISITGLNPPKAQINSSSIAGLDGAIYNSAKLETRNIVITVRINGNVEANRLNLYKFFPTKTKCRFYYSNGSLDVSIDGYVDNVECNLFAKSEIAQISILCLSPYFQSIAEIIADSENSLPQFTFPFSIDIGAPVVFSELTEDGEIAVYNSSESETPTSIEIDFKAAAHSLTLVNTNGGGTLELDFDFATGDKVIVNTTKGGKSVTLMRDGALSNLFSAVKKGSKFFQLKPGVNMIDYAVDGQPESDAVFIVFRFHNSYRGV